MKYFTWILRDPSEIFVFFTRKLKVNHIVKESVWDGNG